MSFFSFFFIGFFFFFFIFFFFFNDTATTEIYTLSLHDALPISRHRILNLLADAVLIVVAWRLTFWIRFDQTIPVFYKHLLDWQVTLLVLGIQLAVFVVFGFYNRWWRYVSTRDMWGAARGVVVACLLVDLVLYAFPPTGTARLPRGIA